MNCTRTPGDTLFTRNVEAKNLSFFNKKLDRNEEEQGKSKSIYRLRFLQRGVPVSVCICRERKR